jgi:hypothetical protein
VIPAPWWTVDVVAQAGGDRPIEPRFRDVVIDGQPVGEIRVAEAGFGVQDAHPMGRVARSLHDRRKALRMAVSPPIQARLLAAGAPYRPCSGRDSLLTAMDHDARRSARRRGTLHTLAAMQGTEVDPHTEEEPGRILHESRLGPDSVTALGGRNYYGTIDATPLFVALLGEAWRWGTPESEIRSLLPAADMALGWMDQYGDRDGDGFLEYQRATDRGLINQGWKDSWDGVTDASGPLAETPIALAEVQGYAYMAWQARAELAEAFDDRDVALTCRDRAAKLRRLFAGDLGSSSGTRCWPWTATSARWIRWRATRRSACGPGSSRTRTALLIQAAHPVRYGRWFRPAARCPSRWRRTTR